MDIRIFGGTGLIGSRLALHLAQKHTVHIITRNVQKHRLRFPPFISLIEWQGNSDISPTYIEGADVIVNLVGEDLAKQYWSAHRKQVLYTSRITTGKQLVQAIRNVQQRPHTFIQASGIGYYPITDDITSSSPCSESHPAGIGTFLSYLARDWEHSTEEVEELGIRRCIIRTSPVLAGEGGILPVLSKPFRYYLGGYPQTGKQPFPCIHIDDEVRAIIHLIENQNSSGAYNLILPSTISTKEFSKLLGTLLHKPCYMKIPQWVLRMFLGEMAEELLLQNVYAVPERLLSEGFTFLYPTVQEALGNIIER